jgi:hypothetical protein
MSGKIAFVTMAAGVGSRYNGSKQLERFGRDGRTIAEYNLLWAVSAGFRDFFFIVDERAADAFHGRLTKILAPNCHFGLIYQRAERQLNRFCNRSKPWGTAHAILCCDGAIGCNFCVANADDLYGEDAINCAAEFLRSADEKAKKFANVAYKLSDTLSSSGAVSRGIIVADGDSVLSIDEAHGIDGNALGASEIKISKDRAVEICCDSPVSMNLWGFTPEIFPLLEVGWKVFKENIADFSADEFRLPTLINDCIKSGSCAVSMLQTKSRWCGVTYRSDREVIEQFLGEK